MFLDFYDDKRVQITAIRSYTGKENSSLSIKFFGLFHRYSQYATERVDLYRNTIFECLRFIYYICYSVLGTEAGFHQR